MAEQEVPYTTGPNRNVAHSDLCRVIRDYLRLRGMWVFRPLGTLGQQGGVPDFICCCSGRMVGIEVKTGKGRLRRTQHEQKAAIEAAGGLVIVAHDLDDVEEALIDAGLVRDRLLWPQREG